ncbi:MAG: RecB family exonuclease [Armatimonadota bacterium]
MRISYSRYATYRHCPQQYRLQYVDRIPTPRAAELEFGTAVHSGLKVMHDPSRVRVPSVEELIDAFAKAWNPVPPEGKAEEWQLRFQQGVELLQRYHAEHAKREEGRYTIDTERFFSLPLEGGHVLTGRIDRVDVTGDKQLEVIDYKTSRRMPPLTAVDQNPQLAIYRLAANQLYPGFKVTTTLLFVLLGQRIQTEQDEEFIRETKDDILDALTSIQLEEFEPRLGGHCDWCAFRPHCALFREPVEPEGLDIDIAAALREYAQADADGKAAYARKEAAKELINRYLDQCQTERVAESGYVAERRPYRRVTRWDVEQLRAALTPLGKWEAVTQVNTTALRRLAESRDLPREVRKLIEEAATYSESRQLRVRALADDEDSEETG